MKHFIDFDGTLACGSLDSTFKQRVANDGIDNALIWYRKVAPTVTNLNLNMPLIQELIALKEQGHTLILWTNRSDNERAATRAMLGIYWHLFSEHRFRQGQKGKDKLEGIVYDNEEKYLSCGLHGSRLIKF